MDPSDKSLGYFQIVRFTDEDAANHFLIGRNYHSIEKYRASG
jgi:hypothetical protein